MARTDHGSRASAPSPYTVSVGNATSPPRRISAAASSRSAGDLALSSRVSTSRNAFERRLVDSFADQLRDRAAPGLPQLVGEGIDRKSTRLNSSHPSISYAVFCLKKKTRCIFSAQVGLSA